VPASGRKDIYQRWEREAPMALWQIDIMSGIFLSDGTEAKIVTGIDDQFTERFGKGGEVLFDRDHDR
jgi:hypothetical protein